VTNITLILTNTFNISQTTIIFQLCRSPTPPRNYTANLSISFGGISIDKEEVLQT